MPRRVSALLSLTLLISACAGYRAPVIPAQISLIASYYRAPLTTDFDETPVGTREGYASTIWFQDIFLTGLSFGFGDISVAEAARSAGIEKVHFADYELLTVLGVF